VAATQAGEAGAKAHELMAIFGWKSINPRISEEELYTRTAGRLAIKAIDKLKK